MTQQTTETDAEKKERSDALRKAYNTATNELRTAHQDEFNALYSKHAEALGQEWKPKPSAKERAKQQLQAILAENPELAEELVKADGSDQQ